MLTKMKPFIKVCLCFMSLYVAKHVIFNQSLNKYDDDLNTINHFSKNFELLFLFFLCYSRLFLCWFLCKVGQFYVQWGPVRLSVYLIFLCLFSYVFVVIILDATVLGIWNVFKSEIVRRFEDNIIYLDGFQLRPTIYRPTNIDTSIFYSYYYKGEDVLLTCLGTVTGSSKSLEKDINVIWLRNGKPLTSSTRFHLTLNVTESTKNDDFAQSASKHTQRKYTVLATLTLYFLDSDGFGNYTCNIVQRIQVSALKKVTHNTSGEMYVGILNSTEERKEVACEILSYHKTKKSFEDKPFFVKEKYATAKFAIVEIPRRQITITAQPGAFLIYRAQYRYRSESYEDVSTEYFINGESAEGGVCRGPFKGCSKLLLLYLYLNFEFFSLGPFSQNNDRESYSEKVKSSEYRQCVCTKTYGRHTTHYVRHFYNVHKGKYELLEAKHPDELIVLPREQNMLNFFQQNITFNETFESLPPEVMHFVKMAAKGEENVFDLCESFLIGTMVGLFVSVLWILCLLIQWIGKYAGRCILNQPLPCLRHREVDRTDDTGDARYNFDILISHSEWDTEIVVGRILPVLRARGQRTCSSELDIPPNLPVTLALSTAVEHSARYIIIWSKEYSKDKLKQNLEVGMISSVAIDRNMPPQTALLVIKNDHSQLPSWLTPFEVHDWTTTTLSRDDQLRRLSRWVQKGNKQNAKGQFLDICSISLPFIILFLFVIFFLAIWHTV
ncbi:uncharacterized protein LOC112567064 [Pomacea canaliculata]|uniref:uncharacterized protein LOC112567064 n=1 Tax=Pomacea canaliculata TaxID=400727 RepID=UPI000D739A59|nr:uncharacterized protein LOC112567064 [Pomacea canaliculata]